MCMILHYWLKTVSQNTISYILIIEFLMKKGMQPKLGSIWYFTKLILIS